MGEIEDRQDELWAIVRNGLQGIVSEIDERLNKKAQVVAQVVNKTYDTTKVAWNPANGKNGPYEKATAGVDYPALKADLEAHGGRMRTGGFFYWIFQDGSAIGRKVLGGKSA